jgi:glycosyltransferase involved in cell wall biosynthesis
VLNNQAERTDNRPEAAPLAKIIPIGSAAEDARLRVCLLGYRSHPYGGGQGIYIKYLSKALVDAGHQVDVISGEPYPHLDPRVKLIKLPGMNIYEKGLGSIRPHHLRHMSNLAEWFGKLTGGFAEPISFGMRVDRYLQQHGAQYDLIHDNQCLAYGMLAIQRRQPLVTTIHHPITSDKQIAINASGKWWEKLLIRRWYRFLTMQKKVARQLHHVVTVSQCSKEDIASAFDMPEESIQLVYNGIDTEVFAPQPNIERKPLRIMATASADAPLKGVRYLIEAFAQLLPRYPGLELLMVSKPKPGGDTERLIARLGLAEHIHFVSGISTEQLVRYYAEATLVVVPSIYEGFGLPAGEAMACGVPVVSTTGGALPEVVADAGLLVPTHNATAIADAVAQLLDDPDARERLAVAGRARILEKFCWNVCARQMTAYYREVLSTHGNS